VFPLMPEPRKPKSGLWKRGALVAGFLVLAIGLWGNRWWTNSVSLSSIQSSIARGDLPHARLLVGRYLEEFPTDSEGFELAVKLAEASRDTEGSVELYRRWAQLMPGDLPIWQGYGNSLLKTARFEEAESVYRTILRDHPTDVTAQTELQWILFHQVRTRELEQFLEQCLALEPANDRLLFHLLMTAQKPPNPHESLPVLERINEAVPGQRSILLGMARCAWKLGEIDRASELFAEVAKLKEPDRELCLALAEFELEQLNIERVQAALDAIPRKSDDELESDDRWWSIRSQLSLRSLNLEEALVQITKAAALYPRSLPYLQSRISLLRLLKWKDEADALEKEAEASRRAEQRLYIIVHSGELQRPTAALAREIATLCADQRKNAQSEGWNRLAERLPGLQ
jgi:tetratricopeptide (TPR) repeat protein